MKKLAKVVLFGGAAVALTSLAVIAAKRIKEEWDEWQSEEEMAREFEDWLVENTNETCQEDNVSDELLAQEEGEPLNPRPSFPRKEQKVRREWTEKEDKFLRDEYKTKSTKNDEVSKEVESALIEETSETQEVTDIAPAETALSEEDKAAKAFKDNALQKNRIIEGTEQPEDSTASEIEDNKDQ